MTIHYTIVSVLAVWALWGCFKNGREYSATLNHLAPTQSVKKKAKRVGLRYISGVYHCKKCDFAGHLFTTGAGPCHHCDKKTHMHSARWSKIKQRWIFRKEKHEH